MDELRLVTHDGRTIPLQGSRLTIGRGADNDVALTVTQVSRHHAELRFDGRGWVLVDLGSTNGTAVDGRRLQPHQPAPLLHGSVVSMGGQDVFHVEDVPVSAIPFPIDPDEFDEPAPPRTSPWVYALAALAAVLLLGVGVLAVLLLKDNDDGATPTSQVVGEIVLPASTPEATDVSVPGSESGPATATLMAVPPPPAVGGEPAPAPQAGGPGQPAAPPISTGSILPTMGAFATSLAPVLPMGTPGAPPGSERYPAPQLVSPSNGNSIQGADTLLMLTWSSVGSLRADEYYHVSLRYNQAGQLMHGGAWIKESEWRVPNWLFGQADQGRFEWDVTVRQETRRTPEGNPDGPALSPKSETWVFTWAGEAGPPDEPTAGPSEPTVEPTPTFER